MSDSPEHSGGEVVLYESSDGGVHLEVRLERESIWLTQKQMAELFGRERSVITRHIQRALADDELSPESNVQKMHIASSDKPVTLYSLDAVISVGYRVNSARGTQFRIWATRTLREHLLRGYTLSETRLREKGFGEIEQAVSLLASTLTRHELVSGEGAAVLDVVQHYTRVPRPRRSGSLLRWPTTSSPACAPHWPVAGKPAACSVRSAAKSSPRSSALSNRRSTGGRSIHRSSCALRICSTSSSRIIRSPTATSASARCSSLSTSLARADGAQRIADNAMVALALLIAESEPGQRDLTIRLIMSLLEGDD
jgi:hypothetical protein